MFRPDRATAAHVSRNAESLSRAWPSPELSNEEFMRKLLSPSWHIFASCTPVFLKRMAPVMQRVSEFDVDAWDIAIQMLEDMLGADFTVQIAETALDLEPDAAPTIFDPSVESVE